jgi:4-hydroxybenzoate polyprenyltransferase/phosphoserine phosphatase
MLDSSGQAAIALAHHRFRQNPSPRQPKVTEQTEHQRANTDTPFIAECSPLNPDGDSEAASLAIPLVVDLDGTLTPIDTLVESVIRAVKHNPFVLFLLPFWLAKGRAAFKAHIANISGFSAKNIPYRESVLSYLKEQKARGREIVLATAAHRSIAESVAAELGIFEKVICSDERVNMKGRVKLASIRQQVGQSFAYIGDTPADIPIWRECRAALLVGSPRGCPEIRRTIPIEHEFTSHKANIATWLRALRVHQWTKNTLIFVPLLTSFAFLDVSKFVAAMLAFVAFSLAASATYLVNDLWDLDNDRSHPRKCLRPLANAQIGAASALLVSVILLATALIVAATVNGAFLVALLAYLIVTSAYSWALKKIMLIDVLVLACLYTLRILAGSVAIGVLTSSWLLVFSVFIFLSLALVKRCSELMSLSSATGAARGRDYRVSDLAVLWPLGVGAGLCSVIVFGLFVSTLESEGRYATPELMWIVCLGLIYWIARLWIKTVRSEMHDDPVVFALKDFGCRITVTGMVVTTLAAHFLELPLP